MATETYGIDARVIPNTRSGLQEIAELSKRMLDLNKGKLLPIVPKEILKESERTRVFIFNAGRRKQEFTMASYGAWNFIGPCLTREELDAHCVALGPDYGPMERARFVEIAPGEFNKPFTVPGIPCEPYWREGKRAELLYSGEEDAEDTGFTMALSAIGIGKNQKRSKSLEKFGVFVSRVSPPLKADVDRAKKAWLKNCREDVNEANEAHKMGKFLGDKGIVQPYHYEAARILISAGMAKTADFPWLDAVAEAATLPESCPYCGTSMTAGLSTCPNCKAVTNWLMKLRADKKMGKRLTADETAQLEELEAQDRKKAKG